MPLHNDDGRSLIMRPARKGESGESRHENNGKRLTGLAEAALNLMSINQLAVRKLSKQKITTTTTTKKVDFPFCGGVGGFY